MHFRRQSSLILLLCYYVFDSEYSLTPLTELNTSLQRRFCSTYKADRAALLERENIHFK